MPFFLKGEVQNEFGEESDTLGYDDAVLQELSEAAMNRADFQEDTQLSDDNEDGAARINSVDETAGELDDMAEEECKSE